MSKYTVNSYLVDDGIQVKTEAGKHTIICDEGLSDGGVKILAQIQLNI